MTRADVEVPSKYKGGVPEEAYRDGYLAGLKDKLVDSATLGMIGELGVEILDKGLGHALSAKGMRQVAERCSKRLGANAGLAEKIADVVEMATRKRRKP